MDGSGSELESKTVVTKLKRQASNRPCFGGRSNQSGICLNRWIQVKAEVSTDFPKEPRPETTTPPSALARFKNEAGGLSPAWIREGTSRGTPGSPRACGRASTAYPSENATTHQSANCALPSQITAASGFSNDRIGTGARVGGKPGKLRIERAAGPTQVLLPDEPCRLNVKTAACAEPRDRPIVPASRRGRTLESAPTSSWYPAPLG